MISRLDYRQRVEKALTRSPIVALLGARQVGKRTLAREFVALDSANYLDLEDPLVTDLMENPMTALQGLKGCTGTDLYGAAIATLVRQG